MLRVEPHGYEPEDTVSVDVGIASDQYQRWFNSRPVAEARQTEHEEERHRLTRGREIAVLAAMFMALFALERILGRKFKGARGAASGGIVTTAARAAAGGS